MRPAASDFSIRWGNGDAVVLSVLQGAVAPSVRKIYDVYYRKTRHEEPPGAVKQIAKKQPTTAAPAAAAPQTAAINQ